MQKISINEKTKRLVLSAALTAIVAVLAYVGGFVKIGSLASISLTLIPVVLGAALLGPTIGAWLGGVAGAVFFVTADAAFWLGLSVHGTIFIVMLKGIASGFLAGVTYKLVARFNQYVAVFVSAVVCPVVNTGIFLLGCVWFFFDAVSAFATEAGMSVGGYLIVVFVGLNFVFELLSNVILSPAIVRLLKIKRSIGR